LRGLRIERPGHPAASPPQSTRALRGKYLRHPGDPGNGAPGAATFSPSVPRGPADDVVQGDQVNQQGADAGPLRGAQTGCMARFRTTISTRASAASALALLADFQSAADWDPGVRSARLISGSPGVVGAHYEVVATFGPIPIPLDYELTERVDPHGDQPGRVVLIARTGSFTSHDTITAVAEGTGSQVTYDAVLGMQGIRRVFDWPLNLAFQVIGSRAEHGLREALETLADASPRPSE
jgi:hypothetical protein